VRLRRVQEEFGDRVQLEWRSFLLRPQPDPSRTLEKFRTYTRSWARPAAEPDAPVFRVWEGDAGPPSHSVPPHLVAKAAATLGDAAFERMHERLLRAYFSENRDITDPDTLRVLWREAELPDDAFARVSDPELAQAVIAQHNEAIEHGVDGVPAVRMEGREGVVIGAQPVELYRRWIDRHLDDASPLLKKADPGGFVK
jgi:predicted DsbA family dithiol-disulfide isomerase